MDVEIEKQKHLINQLENELYYNQSSIEQLKNDVHAHTQQHKNMNDYKELILTKKHKKEIVDKLLNYTPLIIVLIDIICSYSDELISVMYIINKDTLPSSPFNTSIIITSNNILLNDKKYEFKYDLRIKYNMDDGIFCRMFHDYTNNIYITKGRLKNVNYLNPNLNMIVLFNAYVYDYINIPNNCYIDDYYDRQECDFNQFENNIQEYEIYDYRNEISTFITVNDSEKLTTLVYILKPIIETILNVYSM